MTGIERHFAEEAAREQREANEARQRLRDWRCPTCGQAWPPNATFNGRTLFQLIRVPPGEV